MKTSEEIKPCPFCGKNNLIISETKSPDKTVTYYRIHHGPESPCSASLMQTSKQKVIDNWNNRYADHILSEKMKEFAEWVDENYGEESGEFIQDILKKYLKQ